MRRPVLGYAVSLTAVFLVSVEAAKINVALPSVIVALSLGPVAIQVSLAGFMLAAGLSLIPSGRLGDRYTRRALLLAGLALYVVGSALCAAAVDGLAFAAGRVLGGLSMGAVIPQVLGIAQTSFSGVSRVRALAWYGVAFALMNALGPIAAGVQLTVAPELLGWRALFVTNIGAGVLVAVCAWFTVSPQQSRSGAGDVDLRGMLLLAAALTCGLSPLLTVRSRALPPLLAWALPIMGVVLILLFARFERSQEIRGRRVIAPRAMLTNAPFRHGILTGFGWYAAAAASLMLVVLFLQNSAQFSPLAAGMAIAPFALAATFGSWSASVLPISAGGSRARVISAGLVMATGGLAIVGSSSLVPLHAPALALLVAGQIITGFGGGLFVTANQVATLREVPITEAGNAAAFQQLAQRVAAAVGLAATTWMYFGLSDHGFVVGMIFCTACVGTALGVHLSIRAR